MVKAMLPNPIAVEPRDSFRIWLRFADGVEGELDMSHIKGKGVFNALSDRQFFEGVHVNASNVVSWDFSPDGVELDFGAETMYARLLRISKEELADIDDEDAFYQLLGTHSERTTTY